MTRPEASKPKHATSEGKATVGRFLFLDLSGGRVLSLNPDGSGRKVVVTECRHSDGVAADAEAGHIYGTDMGEPPLNDGSIECADLDGRHRTTIVPGGGTCMPEQLYLDKENGKLYWSDREGCGHALESR